MSFWPTAWYLQRPFPTPFCRPAELIYQPPDLTKPVFDIDKIGLTGLVRNDRRTEQGDIDGHGRNRSFCDCHGPAEDRVNTCNSGQNTY